MSSTYQVQSTPKSFNTPLGISKFINNELNSDTQYLILEYGARHKGDIKKLCKLFGADYGIITTISPQHLETFHNTENIYLAKKELSDYLEDRLCVYNLDNIYTYRMHQEKSGEKFGISLQSHTNPSINNVKIVNYSTHFNLTINDQTFSVKTKLLGLHNITNILLATALASKLGVSNKNIIQSIGNLSPTPHRLEYIKGFMHIIDDSYNCSLLSAKEALDVLKCAKHKKMIITPGIIEGGTFQYKINHKLGQMCRFADFLVIIGETNRTALTNGFTNNHENTTPLYAKDLEETKQYFSLLSSDDTLLILNDLPDDFK